MIFLSEGEALFSSCGRRGRHDKVFYWPFFSDLGNGFSAVLKVVSGLAGARSAIRASTFPGATGRRTPGKSSTGHPMASFFADFGPGSVFGVLGYVGGREIAAWAAQLKDFGGI